MSEGPLYPNQPDSQSESLRPDLASLPDPTFEESRQCLEACRVLAEQIRDVYQKTLVHFDEVTKLRASTDDILGTIKGSATQVSDIQKVIATKSEHIQSAQDHADTVRANLDRRLTSATTQLTEIESLGTKALASFETVEKVLPRLSEIEARAAAELETIRGFHERTETASKATKSLADLADAIQLKVTKYEETLKELETQCKSQLAKIETLLPGATSAGLAHAFDERRQTFLKPHSRWQWIFVGSLVTIVILTMAGVVQSFIELKPPTYEELLRMWLMRFPVIGSLIWLALHSSREAALAKRLEEDYGYKSAIANCFEGFQKQLSVIGKEGADNIALAKLLTNTLAIVSNPPGRIYEKHELVITPGTELVAGAKELAKASRDG